MDKMNKNKAINKTNKKSTIKKGNIKIKRENGKRRSVLRMPKGGGRLGGGKDPPSHGTLDASLHTPAGYRGGRCWGCRHENVGKVLAFPV